MENEYNEYLDLFFQEFEELNKERKQKKKVSLLTPILEYSDNRRKTIIINIIDICKSLNRETQHFIYFIQQEIKQEKCFINNENQLIISQYVKLETFKNLMKNYYLIFIKCKKCKGTDTKIERDQVIKKSFIYCNFCKGKEYILSN